MGRTQMDWSSINDIAQIVGMVALPVIGWVFHTVVKHGSKLVMLEEKVNDSIQRRLDSLENKVDGLETKIDNKIDKLEDSLHETQLTMAEKIIEAINKN
jgi:predicted PurR-regulated permease PerM